MIRSLALAVLFLNTPLGAFIVLSRNDSTTIGVFLAAFTLCVTLDNVALLWHATR